MSTSVARMHVAVVTTTPRHKGNTLYAAGRKPSFSRVGVSGYTKITGRRIQDQDWKSLKVVKL
jgi:hypothetical protein